jgi:hypothetical protein
MVIAPVPITVHEVISPTHLCISALKSDDMSFQPHIIKRLSPASSCTPAHPHALEVFRKRDAARDTSQEKQPVAKK